VADIEQAWQAFLDELSSRLASIRQLLGELGNRPLEQAAADHLDRVEAARVSLIDRWREAGVRYPLTIFAAVSFVGGLVLGLLLSRVDEGPEER
jgi:hypothetical protein